MFHLQKPTYVRFIHRETQCLVGRMEEGREFFMCLHLVSSLASFILIIDMLIGD